MAKKPSKKRLETAAKRIGDIVFSDDPVTLGLLDQYGVSFSVETVNISEIDVVGSIKRNIRHTGRRFDKERSEDIAVQMITTEVCTRLVGVWMEPSNRENPSGRKSMLDVLGGNHRLGSLIGLGMKQCQVYVIHGDDEMDIRRLRSNLNNVTGEGNTKAAMLANAYTEYKVRGGAALLSNEDIEGIAELYHLKPAKLKLYIDGQDVKQIIEGNGYRTNNLTDTHFKSLKRLRGNHAVLAAAGRVANNARMTSIETSEMVKEILAEKDGEAAQMARIVVIASEYKRKATVAEEFKNKPTAKRRKVYEKLKENLRRVVNMLEGIDPKMPSHVENTSSATDAELRKLFGKLYRFRKIILRPMKSG